MNLTISFRDAAIKWENKTKSKVLIPKFKDSYINEYKSLSNFEGFDYEHPIGCNQLSNVLHVLCGLPPVASKRNTIFERNEDIFELANKAMIKYDNYFEYYDGKFKGEFTSLFKAVQNSHKTVKTLIDDDLINGEWNWDYFKRITNKSYEYILENICNKLNLCADTIKIEYTFPNIVSLLRKNYHVKFNPEFEKYMSNKYSKNGGVCKTAIIGLLFGVEIDGEKKGKTITNHTNSACETMTPLIINNGVGRKLELSGEIYIPNIPDYIAEAINDGVKIATILDGGIAKAKLNRVGLNNLDGYISILDSVLEMKK